MPDQAGESAPIGLLLSDDMIFTSRITGTARALGITVKAARSAEVLLAMARQHRPVLILVDLSNPGLQLPELMQALQTSSSSRPRIVAYGSHVDAAVLRAARDAGCDPVLPRSKFVEELPRALPEWIRAGTDAPDG
ncbi:MAG TPA: response regulator [Gemmataceae bacterium]|nr:response regulator [Gemmataceae bacterium]